MKHCSICGHNWDIHYRTGIGNEMQCDGEAFFCNCPETTPKGPRRQ